MEYDHQALSKKDKDHYWHPFTQMQDWREEDPVIIVGGEGPYLLDDQGRKFIDGFSSLWVNLHGHKVPEIDTAIGEQLKRIAHTTALGFSSPGAIELAERLAVLAPRGLEKVFYSDSGSEAMEIALKMSLQYWENLGQKKHKFLSFANAYHGDTVGAVSLGGMDLFHATYRPLLFDVLRAPSPYCYRCPLSKKHPECQLACLSEAERLLTKNQGEVAAVVVEPLVQGAAGMITQPKGFLKGLRQLCDKHDILLIVDEVATGFGRTGTIFACEQEGVHPDLMALAKGLTGGYLPLAATLTTDKVYQAFLGDYADKKTFFHGHSYTGNPLACAAALANLKLVATDSFLPGLEERVRWLAEGLQPLAEMPHVGEIRQCGLMVGIELVAEKDSGRPYEWAEKTGVRVCNKVRERGIITRPLGDVIILMPTLNIPQKVLEELVSGVGWAIDQVTRERNEG